MATKYYRLKLKGERSVNEIQSAVGRSGGLVVRVHSEGGETHVYFAGEKVETAEVSRAFGGGETPAEISAEEVTKLG